MNSDFLISENSELYKNFFNKYDLIISTPIHFPIVGDTSIYGNGNGYLITQKIPLKNYIGINFSSKLENIAFTYKENVYSSFIQGKIENFYSINTDFLKKIGLDYDIGFLSEYNWNDPPSIISNILMALLLIKKEFGIDDFKYLDLQNPEYLKFYDKIIELDNHLIREFNFFTNIRNNGSFLGSCILKSTSHILTIGDNGNFEYQNIGGNSDFQHIDLTLSILNTNTFLKTNYNPKLIIESENSLKNFCDNKGIGSSDISMINLLEKISKFYCLKIFQDLDYLYSNNSLGDKFFLDLHVYRKTIRNVFKALHGYFFDLKKIREMILSYVPYNLLNIFIDQIGVCGDSKLIVFSNKMGIIDKDFVKKLNDSTGLNLTLDYSSYYDGYERDGAKLEQYKSEKIYSKFCSDITMKHFDGEKLLIKTIEKDSVDSMKGIVFSKIDKTIHINGEALTSKEILSQTFTIDLFDILLNNVGREISNLDLPQSGYSKNKNELIGKIIVPLNKILLNRLGKQIKIECTGSISEYNILFKPSDINIFIINKTR